jgi:hypothetical protein
MPSTTLITTSQLSRLIALPQTPAIVDVRTDEDYRADQRLVPGGMFKVVLGRIAKPVLRAMRKEGINIVAIHPHMSHEQPRYLFLHYWGEGKAGDLARSLKRVLDAQAAVKP